MRLMILLAVLLLAGCASLQNAGVSEYTVKPFVIGNQVLCCEVSIKSGRELASVTASATKRGDDYSVDLAISGIKAFEGQAIAAEAVGASVDSAAAVGAAAIATPVLGTGLRAVLP